MTIKHVFKSRVSSIKYIFKAGKEANFIAGLYYTSVDSEIAELNAEIEAGHPIFYKDEAELTVDTDNMNPLDIIKQKAVAEYIASQAAQSKDSDKGSYEQGNVNPSSTTDLGQDTASAPVPGFMEAGGLSKPALAMLKANVAAKTS